VKVENQRDKFQATCGKKETAAMKDVTIQAYSRASDLPDVDESNFFHSRQLFEISAATPKMKPYMAVATDATGRVIGQLLAAVRYRTSFIPPFFFMHCRIVGEGTYADSPYRKDELFGEMLRELTRRLNKTTLYIEVSNLPQKMFAYRQFRQQDFFAVRWMSIHNSLHSRTPEERITEKMMKRIDTAYSRGVSCHTVETNDDLEAFNKLLRHHHWMKPKRYIPDSSYFTKLKQTRRCQLFVTKYRQHVIGCSVCAYSDENAFLMYAAFRRKTYLPMHPDAVTIWNAIKYAHAQGYQHINFLDVGLPFRKNPYREFILSFGGKPVSTYRWFRCSIRWINALLKWIYRD